METPYFSFFVMFTNFLIEIKFDTNFDTNLIETNIRYYINQINCVSYRYFLHRILGILFCLLHCITKLSDGDVKIDF